MSAVDSPRRLSDDHPFLRRFAKWVLASASLIVLLGAGLAALPNDLRVGLNATDSLPGLVYVVRAGELPAARGEAVAFRPPENLFYPVRMVFVKKVLGLPGDVVSRAGRDFFINGEYVATAKQRARSGVPLSPGPTGVIPAGTYFLWPPPRQLRLTL